MAKELFEYVKRWGIFAVLFVTLFVWTISNYETREAKYLQHESEYHQIITENNKILTENQKIIGENQRLMGEYQKQLEGFKLIIDVKLDAIQKELEKLRR